jgi:LPS export ABC transporter protein LptC
MNRGGLFLLVFSIATLIIVTWLNSTWLSYKDFRLTQKDKKIDYYLSDFTILNTQADGTMRYFVTAQHLIHQQSTDTSKIFKPLLQARDSDGRFIMLKSDKAEQIKSGEMRLLGDVSIIKKTPNAEDNFELSTQDLVYNPIEKALSSKSKVQLKTPQGQLNGIGFSSKLDEQELRIHSNVQIQFNPPK